jgi:four helix bundle protein
LIYLPISSYNYLKIFFIEIVIHLLIMDAQELQIRLKSFAYRIVNLSRVLPKELVSEIIIKQILRSAFSVAANYRAACRAQSKKAFISKLSIVVEEIDETFFWLEVIADLKIINPNKLTELLKEAEELTKILSSSRKTAQSKLNQ